MSSPARNTAGGADVVHIEDRAMRKAKSHRWTRWRNRLAKQVPSLSPTALELADWLARHADNETGYCYAWQLTIAHDIRRTTRTVSKRIGELREAGVIRYQPGTSMRRTPSQFWLLELDDRNEFPVGSERISGPRTGSDFRSDRQELPVGPEEGSALRTAKGTAQRTEPPLPPRGGRRRDRDAYLDLFAEWLRQEDLLDDRDRAIIARSRMPGNWDGDTRQWLAHEFERETAWRDPRRAGDDRLASPETEPETRSPRHGIQLSIFDVPGGIG